MLRSIRNDCNLVVDSACGDIDLVTFRLWPNSIGELVKNCDAAIAAGKMLSYATLFFGAACVLPHGRKVMYVIPSLVPWS